MVPFFPTLDYKNYDHQEGLGRWQSRRTLRSTHLRTHLDNSHIGATNPKNNLKTSSTVHRRTEAKSKTVGGAETWSVGNQILGETNHKQEGHHKHREAKGTDPTPGPSDTGTLHWEDKSL